jgi:acetyl/propionyl-CoA carboxylase alpha subunit
VGVRGGLASVTSGVRLASNGEEREVRLAGAVATLAGREVPFREIRADGAEDLVALEVAGEIFPVRTARAGDRVFVWCAGRTLEVRREMLPAARRRSSGAADAGAGLLAPMPGRVRRISIPRGQRVAKGDVVLVLEAMKMEHAIRAPRDGVVTRLDHREGDLVDAGAVLAEIS